MKLRNLKLILATLPMVASVPAATAADDHLIWKSGRYGIPPVAQSGAQERLKPAAPSVTPKASDTLGAPLPKPDLMTWAFYPLPSQAGLPLGFPGVVFCVANPAGGASAQVRFRVRNMTAGPAAASMAHVKFSGAGTVKVPIPAIAGNGETVATANIPAGCYPPGYSTNCEFKIVLDAAKQVQEASEANNTTGSMCVGPAT